MSNDAQSVTISLNREFALAGYRLAVLALSSPRYLSHIRDVPILRHVLLPSLDSAARLIH